MITFEGQVNIPLDDYEFRRVVVGLSIYATDMKKRADEIFDNLPDDSADRTMAINEADSLYSVAARVTELVVKITDIAADKAGMNND